MPIFGLEDDFQAIAEQLVADASAALMDDLIEAAPVGTGELRDSARGPEINGLSATVAFDAPQADWTNEGVLPHGIDGNPLMTFYWDPPHGPLGPGVHSFEHVDHPGQEATRWFDNIVDEWDTYVTEADQ